MSHMRHLHRATAFLFFLLLLLPAAASVAKKELVVAAHYAPWYRGGGPDGSWSFPMGNRSIRTAYKPLLGYYNNLNPAVLNQHITWAKKFGVNTFMIEWNGQDTYEFYSPLDISMQSFVQNPNFKEIDFFLVYSMISGLKRPNDPPFTPVDLNKSWVLNKLVSDFRYASRYYMKRGHYLKIHNRPVVYLWSVTLTKGSLKKAVKRLRNVIKAETGKNPYIIADVVAMYTDPDPNMTKHFDAVMPYLMLEVNGHPPQNYKLKDSLDKVAERYRYFYYVCQDLETDFVPAVFPGFDAVGAPWCYEGNNNLTTPTVKRSTSSFRDLVTRAKSFIDNNNNMLYVTSWSEWNEGTNIEPSEQFQYKYLNALKDGLEGEAAEKPARNRLKFRFKKVVDLPGGDDRKLGASFQLVEFLDANFNPVLTLDVGTDEVRKSMGWGWYGNEYDPSYQATFSWAGKKKRLATLYINVPADAKYLKLIMSGVQDQVTTIHLDDLWLTNITTSFPFRWTQHIFPIN